MAAKALACLAFQLAVALAFTLADDTCVYTVFVRTGKIIKAGTDANISAAFYDDVAEEYVDGIVTM